MSYSKKDEELRLLFKTHIEDLRFCKKQQWKILNLTLLAIAGLVSLTLAYDNYFSCLVGYIIFGLFFISAVGIGFMIESLCSMIRFRRIKLKIAKTFETVSEVSEISDEKESCANIRDIIFTSIFVGVVILSTVIAYYSMCAASKQNYDGIERGFLYMCDWTKGDVIQLAIAIILFVTLIVFVINLSAFWKQYCSTQLLNRPLCAVKGFNVGRAAEKSEEHDIIKMSALLKNFGKYQANQASITWKMVALKGSEKKEDFKGWMEIGVLNENQVATNITMLPEQEFEQWLLFIEKKDLDGLVDGYKKAVQVNINVEFLDMNKKREVYNCSYLITKMLGLKDYLYEVSLAKSWTER